MLQVSDVNALIAANHIDEPKGDNGAEELKAKEGDDDSFGDAEADEMQGSDVSIKL